MRTLVMVALGAAVGIAIGQAGIFISDRPVAFFALMASAAAIIVVATHWVWP
jgi:hypothetical protein